MTTIASHTPANGNKFFYVETSHGFMCSFSASFEDVWFVEDLDSEDRIDGPDDSIIEQLVADAIN